MSAEVKLVNEIKKIYGFLGLSNIYRADKSSTFNEMAYKYNYIEFTELKWTPNPISLRQAMDSLSGFKELPIELENEIETLRLGILSKRTEVNNPDSEVQNLLGEFRALTGSHGLQQLYDIVSGAVLSQNGTRLFSCLSDKDMKNLEAAYQSELKQKDKQTIQLNWQRYRIAALFSEAPLHGNGMSIAVTQLLATVVDRSLAFEYLDYLILDSTSIQGKIYRNYIKSSELSGMMTHPSHS